MNNKRFLFILSSIQLLLFIVPASSMALGYESDQHGSNKRILTLLNWSEYLAPAIVKKFEKKYDVSVKEIYYESDDYRDNYILETQAKGLDIIIINGARIHSYVRQKWISPVTEKEVPNLKYIDKKWLNLFEAPPGYVVPYFWGTTGIAYRKDLVKAKVTSWKDLFQPQEAQRGKVAMIGAHRDLVGHALKSLGYSINSTSIKELKDAKALLLKQKPYVKSYNYITLGKESSMVNGDIHMAMGYNGDIITLQQHNKNIVYVVPDEGSALWVDFMAVSRQSVNKDIAYKFLNFINEPEIAAQQALWVNYATPNNAAKKLLPQKILADTLTYPPQEVLEKLEIYKRLPPRVTRFTNEIFSRVTQ